MYAARWLRCSAAGAAVASSTSAGVAATSSTGTSRTTTAAPAPVSEAGVSTTAAGGAPPPPPPPSPPGQGHRKKVNSVTAWRTLSFKPWQLRAVHSAELRSSMPAWVLYHGEQLGPRPLVVLDHSLPPLGQSTSAAVDACEQASKKYEAMLSSLAWEYGAVFIPLPVSIGEANVMEESCHHVCAVLDALDVQWSHVLAHSYGALVAARMAASTAHPHRVGTVLLLDTPLVTESLVRNMRQREDIAKARGDVNVPSAELNFAIESLKSALEPTLPLVDAADKALYENYLFSPDSLFREGGLVRVEDRYVPVRHLAQVHHPLQLLVPTQHPVVDFAIHKELFGLRRPATIKTAETHEDLFSEKCAGEVADVVRAWMQRFEPDVVIRRRFEQAAKEMGQLMGSDTSSGEKSDGGAEKKVEKKKEKKKKGKQ
ncbi:Alpha/beta hydrolase family [Novymonas esmeraldas]|uniref:Alpha/beta hydrolase family n=1 Tax=Novymonas esmeraldas TaxID=1808958 RepID=A0AAW0ELT5_9TRYP